MNTTTIGLDIAKSNFGHITSTAGHLSPVLAHSNCQRCLSNGDGQ